MDSGNLRITLQARVRVRMRVVKSQGVRVSVNWLWFLFGLDRAVLVSLS